MAEFHETVSFTNVTVLCAKCILRAKGYALGQSAITKLVDVYLALSEITYWVCGLLHCGTPCQSAIAHYTVLFTKAWVICYRCGISANS